jgi:hypothetical protein
MNVKDIVLQLDAKSGSVYDFNLHMPVPTLEKLRAETGIDLLAFAGNETKARADLKMHTLTAKNILMGSKTRNSANDMEYLIATNETYRNDFISYVCSFIYDILFNGLLEKLNDIVNAEDLTANLSFGSFAILKGSSLRNNQITGVKYKYRVGY